jgi:NAD(P)-dependent dehydrogenase (short-subunit alcohol dehydrogenase family)
MRHDTPQVVLVTGARESRGTARDAPARARLLMYVGSTTSRLHEPFLGPYVASKAAGDALAEIMAMEVRPLGIDSVILVPGAFTSGTEHFSDASRPAQGHRSDRCGVSREAGRFPAQDGAGRSGGAGALTPPHARYAGRMFWFTRKRLPGSNSRLIADSRA